MDGGPGPNDASRDLSTSLDVGADLSSIGDAGEPPDGATPAVVCAGTRCAAAELCCLATGTCFDPSSESCDGDSDTCASNLDCEPDELCEHPEGLCLGPGRCVRRPPSEECGPGAQVCGCDGATYESRCEAYGFGIRISPAGGACGEEPTDGPTPSCGRDSDCPGTSCCFLTGTCLPEGCDDCCQPPPPGTRFPCREDSHCGPDAFCETTPGECGGLGGCRDVGGSCSGELSPVCGCDGRSYSNECWARLERTSVGSEGECGD